MEPWSLHFELDILGSVEHVYFRLRRKSSGKNGPKGFLKRLLKVARREVIRKENLSRVRSPKANFARSSAAYLGDRESNQKSLGAVFFAPIILPLGRPAAGEFFQQPLVILRVHHLDVVLRIESLQLADLSILLRYQTILEAGDLDIEVAIRRVEVRDETSVPTFLLAWHLP